jgi:hypothetical protein
MPIHLFLRHLTCPRAVIRPAIPAELLTRVPFQYTMRETRRDLPPKCSRRPFITCEAERPGHRHRTKWALENGRIAILWCLRVPNRSQRYDFLDDCVAGAHIDFFSLYRAGASCLQKVKDRHLPACLHNCSFVYRLGDQN